MVTLILVMLLMVCALILWLYASPFYWKRKGVPYLWSWPIFGSILPSFTITLAKTYQKLYENYPNERFFGFHFFTKPALLLKDPDLIKDIFIKDFDYFSSAGYWTDVNHDVYGLNVFFQYGEAWKEIRSKLTNYFTPHKLRNSLPDYVDVSVKKFNETIKESVEKKIPIEIDKILYNLTTDIIVQAVYAVETDCFNKNSYFKVVGEKIFGMATNLRMLISLIEPKLNSLLKIKIQEEEIMQFFNKLFKDVLTLVKENKLPKHELLQGMIKLLEENKYNKHRGKLRYFSDNTRIPEYDEKTVSIQLMILVAGGIETTALTMILLLYELSLNQDIQEKCRKEIQDVIRETGADISADDARKLTYLRMAINETLRKYPPFAMIPRRCTRRYQFRDSNLTIDPDTIIILPIQSIHWDPKHYPEPEKFLPERFSDENKASMDSATFLAWGFGPKSCLGMNFAILELLLVSSRLLNTYRFTLSSETNVPLKFQKLSLAAIPDPGVWVFAEPLK